MHQWEKDTIFEAELQDKTIKAIREKYGFNVWLFKTHDQCRVGIPDLVICFFGHFVAIELKRPKGRDEQYNDSDVTPLQKYNIGLINKARGSAFVGRSVPKIMERLEKIKEALGIDL